MQVWKTHHLPFFQSLLGLLKALISALLLTRCPGIKALCLPGLIPPQRLGEKG